MTTKKQGSVAQQAALKKLAAMKGNKGKTSGGSYIKLDDGDKKVIRIAAPWTGDPEDAFYVEQVQHFGLGPDGKTPGNCPGRDKCPACKKVWDDREQLIKKAASDLKAKGSPSDKKAAVKHAMTAFKKQWSQAGRIGGKTRYTVNAVEIDTGSKSVEGDSWSTFSFGPQIMTQILTFFSDEIEWGVFYNDDTLYDFIIERIGSDMDTEYKVMTTRKYTTVDTTGLNDPQDLSANKYYQPNTPEEIQALLDGEALDEAVEDDEEEAPKVNIKLAKKKAAPVEEEEEDVIEEEDEEVAPPPAKKKASSLEAELKAAAKGKKK